MGRKSNSAVKLSPRSDAVCSDHPALLQVTTRNKRRGRVSRALQHSQRSKLRRHQARDGRRQSSQATARMQQNQQHASPSRQP